MTRVGAAARRLTSSPIDNVRRSCMAMAGERATRRTPTMHANAIPTRMYFLTRFCGLGAAEAGARVPMLWTSRARGARPSDAMRVPFHE